MYVNVKGLNGKSWKKFPPHKTTTVTILLCDITRFSLQEQWERELFLQCIHIWLSFFGLQKKKTTSTQNFKWDICPLNMRRTGRKMKNSLNVSLDVSLRLLIAEPACFYSTAQSESQTNRTWRLMDTGVREQGSVISLSDWWNWMEAAVQWWRARVNNLRQHRRHSHKQTNEGEKQGRMKKKKKEKVIHPSLNSKPFKNNIKKIHIISL